jgi:hypothetical protein
MSQSEIRFKDRGVHHLKGLAARRRLYRVEYRGVPSKPYCSIRACVALHSRSAPFFAPTGKSARWRLRNYNLASLRRQDNQKF